MNNNQTRVYLYNVSTEGTLQLFVDQVRPGVFGTLLYFGEEINSSGALSSVNFFETSIP